MPRVFATPESPGRYRGIAAVGPWLCACIVLLLACGAAGAAGQPTAPKRIAANGAEFHYVESGAGEPLILLHGGQGDYRSMAAQAEALSPRYRVIAYSRRFHYPNDNPIPPGYRSGYPDAADLAAFVRALGLGRVHLVGTSAGALTALLFAMDHPDQVRSLVLAEPPIHRWARDDAAGRPLYDAFLSGVWAPAGAAFRRGDDVAGMRALVDGFAGAPRFDGLSPAARAVALQNARFFRVATGSPDPFPAVDKAGVARLRMPILIVTGEHTVPLHRFVNAELAKVLPRAERATIVGAGHGAAREKPREFNEAVLGFLSRFEDPAAAAASSAGQPADAFMDRLRRHCGQAFAGRVIADTPPPTGEDPFAGKALVMHVRGCEAKELRIPFHVGDDRSRTWILTRTASGLRLKHDHRHADGTPDASTMYGGDTAAAGSERRQAFPVDAASIALFEATGRTASTTNTWAMEIEPGQRFLYELSRPGGRLFQVEFDLTRPVALPPPPWGHE